MRNGDRLPRAGRAQGVKEAYARHLLGSSKAVPVGDVQVGAVCAKYLGHLKSQAGEIGDRPRGVAKTFRDRGQTLFDFCYGFPGEFFCDGNREKRERKGNAEAKRIHDEVRHACMLRADAGPYRRMARKPSLEGGWAQNADSGREAGV